MAPDDLTPTQVAELLHVDSSTLRRWARAFKAHLSPEANAKKRRYTRTDLAVLLRARELLHAGKSPAEVNVLLGTTPAPQVPMGSGTPEAQLPAVAEVQYPSVVRDLEQALETLRGLDTRLEQLEQDLTDDRKRIDELATEIDQARRRGFFARIFNRWPNR